MTIPAIISAAAHSGSLASVTIRATSEDDCRERVTQLRAAGASVDDPTWVEGTKTKQFGAMAISDGCVVFVMTDAVVLERAA